MSQIKFIKAVASGNDFILIDNCQKRLLAIGYRLSDFVKAICRRKKSVGADGALLIEGSKVADCKMRVFNPDGSEVAMCGNGARCAALYYLRNRPHPAGATGRPAKGARAGRAKRAGLAGNRKVCIETKAGVLEAEVLTGRRADESTSQRVKVKMSEPQGIELDFSLAIDGKNYAVNFIDTGVPHVVNFVDDLEGLDVKVLGSKFRHHDEFKPEGTNADFVKLRDDGEIDIRTYERGVEDETLSCGTGAVAGAILAFRLKKFMPPIQVHTRDGEVLRVYFSQRGSKITDVYLEGDAELVYEGVVNYV